MESFDHLQRAFFDGVYTYRIPIAIGSAILGAALATVAWRVGWLRAARRHPLRTGVVAVAILAIAVPLTWYVASPLVIRTQLIEPGPVAAGATHSASSPSPSRPAATPTPASAVPTASESASVEPTPFVPSVVAAGSFSGTDDFHFGRGTASIIETEAGAYVLRLEDFSVRNGPDLFVYLSPDRAGYADDALELGRLKATDGSFGYQLPAGADPADFASAIIWCKQFSHLFAVAPFEAV